MTRNQEDEPTSPPFALPHTTSRAPGELDAVRAQIVADLEATQGAWRRKSTASRFTYLGVGAATALLPWVALHRPLSSLSGALLVVAGVLALVAAGTVTQWPAAGSRLAVTSALIGLLGVVLEGTRGGDGVFVQLAFKCGALTAACVALPAALLAVHLDRARFPARFSHVLGLASVGVAGSAAVWAACKDTHGAHLLLEHSLALILGVALSIAGARQWLERRRQVRSAEPAAN
jgi:hypothetical protein